MECVVLLSSAWGSQGRQDASAKNQLLLPLIPAASVVGRPCLPAACRAFETVGLQLESPEGGSVFKAVVNLESLFFWKREVRSSEVSLMLRALLRPFLQQGQRVTSRSLRVTLLTWASKYGFCIEDRDILGRRASDVLERALYTAGTWLCQRLSSF